LFQWEGVPDDSLPREDRCPRRKPNLTSS
jgi:hypothetical protein